MSRTEHDKHAGSPESADQEALVQSHDEAAEAGEQQMVADEIGNLNDQILRLRADFENLRRRTRREQLDISERTRAEVIMKLLPVIDHFDLGLGAARGNGSVPEGILHGFQMVYDQLCSLVEKSGVTVIEAEGNPFDPTVHECIAHVPSDKHAENTVITQTRRGYRMGSQVLRAAQVVVSSGPNAGGAGQASQLDEADG